MRRLNEKLAIWIKDGTLKYKGLFEKETGRSGRKQVVQMENEMFERKTCRSNGKRVVQMENEPLKLKTERLSKKQKV